MFMFTGIFDGAQRIGVDDEGSALFSLSRYYNNNSSSWNNNYKLYYLLLLSSSIERFCILTRNYLHCFKKGTEGSLTHMGNFLFKVL